MKLCKNNCDFILKSRFFFLPLYSERNNKNKHTMFKPISKKDTIAKIKNYLLEGYILRNDARGESPIEVVSRELIDKVPTMGNIGTVPTIEEIHCSRYLLFDAIVELEKDYSIRKVSCSYSGCCQYATYATYID